MFCSSCLLLMASQSLLHATRLVQELHRLVPAAPSGVDGLGELQPQSQYDDASAREAPPPPPPEWASPKRHSSPHRFSRPRIQQEQRSSLDFGVQVFAPPPPAAKACMPSSPGGPGGHGAWPPLAAQQQPQHQQLLAEAAEEQEVVALPSTASQLFEASARI